MSNSKRIKLIGASLSNGEPEKTPEASENLAFLGKVSQTSDSTTPKALNVWNKYIAKSLNKAAGKDSSVYELFKNSETKPFYSVRLDRLHAKGGGAPGSHGRTAEEVARIAWLALIGREYTIEAACRNAFDPFVLSPTGKPLHKTVEEHLVAKTFEAQDALLKMGMSRLANDPPSLKRPWIHSSSAVLDYARMEVLEILRRNLPVEVYRKEEAQGYGPCDSATTKSKIADALGRYRPKTRKGEIDPYVVMAKDLIVAELIRNNGGEKLKRWDHLGTLMSLVDKNKGRTQAGMRFHKKFIDLSPTDFQGVLSLTADIMNMSEVTPIEIGTRRVATKINVDDDGQIVSRVPKERLTFNTGKLNQLIELSFIYPLQQVMAEMPQFVALMGHDATFAVDGELRRQVLKPRITSISLDVSKMDQCMAEGIDLCLGTGLYKGNGILPGVFDVPEGQAFWDLWARTMKNQPTWLLGHLIFPNEGYEGGMPSGSGCTNAFESLTLSVLTLAHYLKYMIEVAGVPQERTLDLAHEDLVNSGFFGVYCGDDSVVIYDWDKIASVSGKPLDSLPEFTNDDLADYLRDFGIDVSREIKKVSYTDRNSTRKLIDFTAHLCFISYDEVGGDVTEELWGYYPVIRMMTSQFWMENESDHEYFSFLGKVYSDWYNGIPEGSFPNTPAAHKYMALTIFSCASSCHRNPSPIMEEVTPIILKNSMYGGGIHLLVPALKEVEKSIIRINVRGETRALLTSSTFRFLATAFATLLEDDSMSWDLEVVSDFLISDEKVWSTWMEMESGAPLSTWDDIMTHIVRNQTAKAEEARKRMESMDLNEMTGEEVLNLTQAQFGKAASFILMAADKDNLSGGVTGGN